MTVPHATERRRSRSAIIFGIIVGGVRPSFRASRGLE
jgi:hypothetical protein